MTEFRILVCGGRDYDNRERLFKVLDTILSGAILCWRPFVLIHGGARGADCLAHEWAAEWQEHVSVRVYEADWATHGKRAGPIRNIKMLTEGQPHAIIAFKGGNGTAHMMKIGREAGVPVYEVKE